LDEVGAIRNLILELIERRVVLGLKIADDSEIINNKGLARLLFLNLSFLPFRVFDFSVVNTVAETIEILVSLVALDHLHLHQRNFVADSSVQLLQALSNTLVQTQTFVTLSTSRAH